MTLQNKFKLKKLLELWPIGTAATTSWLESLGISRQLRLSYQKNRWLESIHNGAYKRYNDNLNWQGAIYGIQKQSSIYPGALTAISLQGSAHYLSLNEEKLYLLAQPKAVLPKWFKSTDWGVKFKLFRTGFLLKEIGFIKYELRTFNIIISSLERAILECLYLAPEHIDLVECYQIMEGLLNLRPQMLQELLENCTSVKVIRLFLYMAEKAKHGWFKYLDTKKFNMGSGDRSIISNGVYVTKYRITIPRELIDL